MAESTIAATLVGCVGCQAGVEFLQTKVRDSLNLITFATFVFTTAIGLVTYSKFFTVRNLVPIRDHLHIVIIYFIVNLANNYAMKCDIYFPLFIIFKSGTLIVNMLLGFLLRNYRYSLKQIFSVSVVTGGIVIFTLASYEPSRMFRTSHTSDSFLRLFPFPPFVVGVFLLSVALVLSAYLGIIQEQIYHRYGKRDEEMMFYVHFLSLPAFALIGDEMNVAWQAANRSPSAVFFGIDSGIPETWCYIIGICALQFMCTRNVYKLSSVTSSLNVTMVITLRKFSSLLLSFVLFDNVFNYFHGVGAFFVLFGSVLFSTTRL